MTTTQGQLHFKELFSLTVDLFKSYCFFIAIDHVLAFLEDRTFCHFQSFNLPSTMALYLIPGFAHCLNWQN